MFKYKKGDVVYFNPHPNIPEEADYGIIEHITEYSYRVSLYTKKGRESWFLKHVYLNENALLEEPFETDEVMNNILINLNKLEKRIKKRT